MTSIDIRLFEKHLFGPENKPGRFSVGLGQKDIADRLNPLISDTPGVKDRIIRDGERYLTEILGWKCNNTPHGEIYLPPTIGVESIQKVLYR